MKIISGLGNPGDPYRLTRHNMGYLVVDALADECSIPIQKKKFEAQLGDGRIAEHRVLLVKPQTFMNLSGMSLRQILDFYQKTTDDLLVIHDDLDLSFGTVRVKVGGGDGGHKGIRSLIDRTWVMQTSHGCGWASASPPSRRTWNTTSCRPSRRRTWSSCRRWSGRPAMPVLEIIGSGVRPAMNRFNTRERKSTPNAENTSE